MKTHFVYKLIEKVMQSCQNRIVNSDQYDWYTLREDVVMAVIVDTWVYGMETHSGL